MNNKIENTCIEELVKSARNSINSAMDCWVSNVYRKDTRQQLEEAQDSIAQALRLLDDDGRVE